MRDFIYELMTDYTAEIIFIHVVSAVIWVGGLMAVFIITRHAKASVSAERRLSGRAKIIKNYFKFLIPFIVLLFVSSVFMALGYRDSAYAADGFVLDMDGREMYDYIMLKGAIWFAMVFSMIFMFWIVTIAEKSSCNPQKAMDCMWLVNTYILPINIILGCIAIYMGVSIRHEI